MTTSDRDEIDRLQGELASALHHAAAAEKRATANERWRQMMSDLDRCPHGRHIGDTCAGWRGPGIYDGGCKDGRSLGNPLNGPCAVLGVDVYARLIVVPEDRADRNDPIKWIVDRKPGEELHHHFTGYVGEDADLWQDAPS